MFSLSRSAIAPGRSEVIEVGSVEKSGTFNLVGVLFDLVGAVAVDDMIA
jgi:hypothetical protein